MVIQVLCIFFVVMYICVEIIINTEPDEYEDGYEKEFDSKQK